jgi:hypothetical protein
MRSHELRDVIEEDRCRPSRSPNLAWFTGPSISEPADTFEQEADRAAGEIMV